MQFFQLRVWSGLSFPPLGIFLTQGSNPYLLHWQVDSLPLSHPGSPGYQGTKLKFKGCRDRKKHEGTEANKAREAGPVRNFQRVQNLSYFTFKTSILNLNCAVFQILFLDGKEKNNKDFQAWVFKGPSHSKSTYCCSCFLHSQTEIIQCQQRCELPPFILMEC